MKYADRYKVHPNLDADLYIRKDAMRCVHCGDDTHFEDRQLGPVCSEECRGLEWDHYWSRRGK